MNRWMMWALMGLTVGALMVAGCGGGGDGTWQGAHVRAKHTASDIGPVDLYVIKNDQPGNATSLTDLNPMFVSVENGEIILYSPVKVGDYEFVFTDVNTKKVLVRDYLYLQRKRLITVRLEGASNRPVLGFNITSAPK